MHSIVPGESSAIVRWIPTYTTMTTYLDILLPGCLFIYHRQFPFEKQPKRSETKHPPTQPAVRFSLSSVLLEPEQANASCNPPLASERAPSVERRS